MRTAKPPETHRPETPTSRGPAPKTLVEDALSRSWKGLLARGLLATLFGLALFAIPRATVTALVLVFGAFALVEGVLCLTSAFSSGRSGWASLLYGVVGIGFGLIALVAPVVTAYSMLILIAAWAIVTGVFELAVAYRLRNAVAGSWSLGLSGALSILLGVLVAAVPGLGLVALAWMVGGIALLTGATHLMLAWRLRSLSRGPATTAPPH